MRRGFSLIEVMIATVILAVVGVALLQMGSKNQKIDDYVGRKNSVAHLTSIIGFHHDPKFNNTQKSLYDFLKNDYTIDNMEIKSFLEKRSVRYVEQKVTTVDFGESNDSVESRDIMRFEIKRASIIISNITANLYFLEY
jgi:prepilin-type N-terminal cleavage/methylation domain-containing protein